MKKVPVRRLLDFRPEDFSKRLKSSIRIEYEDKVEVVCTAHEATIIRHILSILEGLDKIPIVSKYDIKNYYSAGRYIARTLNDTLEAILEDIVNVYVKPKNDRRILGDVYAKMLRILNNIHNDVVHEYLEYSETLKIDDFLEIQLNKELLDAIEQVKVKKDIDSVNHTYDVLDKVIRESDNLTENPIAIGYIAGMINKGQIKQMLASRGYVTEIDGTIFKYPIANGFVLGMDNIYDMAVESRSGAKALYLSNKAIQDSEYLAREMQLVAMIIERLVDGDCGNKEYINWFIRPAEDGRDSDFGKMIGKRYLCPDTHKEKIITKDDTHLIGRYVNIRNAMRCKLADKKHICSSCFGELSYGVPAHANLGHLCVTIVTAIVSQLILSTKHVITSASTGNIVLNEVTKQFFTIKNKDSYAFRANITNKARVKVELVVSQDGAFGIKNLKPGVEIRKLNPSRVSKIESVSLKFTTKDKTGESIEYVSIPISIGNRKGSFTYDFLEYILEQGYTLNEQDNYVINLSQWPHSVPFIVLPQVEYSYLQLAKAIKALFKYMPTTEETPEALLQKTFDLINSKLNINIALLEVIVYAFTTYDAVNHNYDLGRNSENSRPMKIGTIIKNRSLSGSYAWEDVAKTIVAPSSYYGNNGVDHPLDVMLMPNETLLDYNKEL